MNYPTRLIVVPKGLMSKTFCVNQWKIKYYLSCPLCHHIPRPSLVCSYPESHNLLLLLHNHPRTVVPLHSRRRPDPHSVPHHTTHHPLLGPDNLQFTIRSTFTFPEGSSTWLMKCRFTCTSIYLFRLFLLALKRKLIDSQLYSNFNSATWFYLFKVSDLPPPYPPLWPPYDPAPPWDWVW